MAWQLLAAALPAAAKVAGTALNKPRQEDYKPQTDYMKKYLSFIRGRSADKEVMHQAMQPALKVAGRQGRRMQQQVGYDVAKSGLGGSGIEAQMRLSAGQQTQDALATATDKAVAAQAAETSRIGQQAAGITAQIGAEEARADQAYKAAQSQYRRQLTSDVIGGVASVASAGIAQAGQLNEAKLLATKRGYFGSAEDVQGMVDQGWTAQMLQQESARIDQQVNSMLGSGIDRSDLYTELGLGSGYNADMSSVVAVPSQLATAEKGAMEVAGMAESGTSSNAIVDNVDSMSPDMINQTNQLLAEKRAIAEKSQSQLSQVEPTVETLPTIKDDQKNKIKQIRTSARINEDGSESTVLMAQSDNIAFPTLFPKDPANPSSDPNDWIELEGDAAFKQAKKRGEVFEFGSESEAKAFAEGNWKDKQERKDINRAKYRKKEQERIDREKTEKLKTDKQRLIKIRKEQEEKKIEKKQLKETMAIYKKQEARAETEKVIAEGAKRANYKKLIDKKMKITRDGKDYNIVVKDIDLENKKVNFIDIAANKKEQRVLRNLISIVVFTNMASKGSKNKYTVSDNILDAIRETETGGATKETLLESQKKEGAIGAYQQRNIFYEEVTKNMGFPEYDRNNFNEARKAAKHYIEYLVNNRGLTEKEAVAAYNAGVQGGKKGYGDKYTESVYSKIKDEV